MDLTFDLQLGRFVSTAGARDTFLETSAKRGDNFPIRITFCRGLVVQELESGATGVLGLKEKLDHAGNFVASASSWTLVGSGSSAYYEMEMNLSTTAIDDLLGVGGSELESVALAMELQFIEGDRVSSSNTVTFTVYNDYVRNTESGPTIVEEGAPVNQVLASLETALSGSNNDLRYVSKLPGASGNAITIAYAATTLLASNLSVSVSTNAITVNFLNVIAVGSADVDWSAGIRFTKTLGFNTTFTFSNVTNGKAIEFYVSQPGGGGWGINWPSGITWAAGPPGTITAGTAIKVTLTATSGSTFNGSFTTGATVPTITTAAQAKTAIEASTAANALVTVTNKSGNDGTGTLATLAATALSGGITATPGFIGSQRVDSTYFYWVSSVTSGVPTWLRTAGSSF